MWAELLEKLLFGALSSILYFDSRLGNLIPWWILRLAKQCRRCSPQKASADGLHVHSSQVLAQLSFLRKASNDFVHAAGWSQTSGFPAAKHMQQKMATPSHLKGNTKQNGESFTIEIIFGLHIYIFIYIFFSYAACDFKPKLRNHFFQSQARCHMLLLVAGIADIDCRQPWGIVQIFRWVTLAVQLYVWFARDSLGR